MQNSSQDAPDEIQAYIDEIKASDIMRSEILRLLLLLQRCQELPFAYKSALAKWLRQARKEICIAEDSFDPVFIHKHLLRQLAAFEHWIVPFIPTEKLAVPQEPLRLRTFVPHDADTDKTVAIVKIQSNGNK